MYSFIDSAVSILNPSIFLGLLSGPFAVSSPTILSRTFHASDGALAPTTMSAIVLSFSTAFRQGAPDDQ